MKYLKNGKLLTALAVSLVLSGCGKEEVPPPANTAPTVTVQSSVSIEEGDFISIPYSLSDSEQTSLSVTLLDLDGKEIKDGSLEGTLSLDKENSKINYTAPWLSDVKTFDESFVVRVSDGQSENAESEQRVDILVSDINSPTEITVTPPSGAYGYENTQTKDSVNFWYAENAGEVKLRFELEDEDEDNWDISFELNEGVIFKNQVSTNVDGNTLILSFTPPNITNIYEDIIFSLSVNDGDDTSVSTASITLVNKPVLTWKSKSSNSISESNGGTLYFSSSEGFEYPGDYRVEITDLNGGELKFDPGMNFSSETGTLSFSDISSFQGNQTVKVKVSLANTIPHLGGETYNEVTVLEKTITFVDDRDDDFNVYLDEFYEYRDKVNDAIERNDEQRLVNTVASFLYLNRYVKESDSVALKEVVASSLEKEKESVSVALREISNAINNDADTEVLRDSIEEFKSNMLSYGKETRELMQTEVVSLLESQGVQLPFSLPDVTSGLNEYSESLTHYVGNSRYGSFSGTNKSWVFASEYKYMDVVDYTDESCF